MAVMLGQERISFVPVHVLMLQGDTQLLLLLLLLNLQLFLCSLEDITVLSTRCRMKYPRHSCIPGLLSVHMLPTSL